MDYNNQNHYEQPEYYRDPGTTFALISMLLGIGSIFTLFTVYLPVILGSLSILFAILSRGCGKTFLATAKVGIGTAFGGIVLIVTLMSTITGLILGSSRENLLQLGQQMDQSIEEQIGITPKELIGESYEEIMNDFADIMGK